VVAKSVARLDTWCMSRAGDDPHLTADHEHGSELSETQLRVRALESILVEKGYVDPAALDVLIETYETRIGPHNGARVVANAWVDPDFRVAVDRHHCGDRLAGLWRPAGGDHGGAGEHRQRAQPGRVHVVLVLPVAGAGAAAGVVQVGALPLARGCRSAWGAPRLRGGAAAGHTGPRVGFHRGAALSGGAHAPGRHRRLGGSGACPSGHARLDDRGRPAQAPTDTLCQ
jgi:nitrile hydratase alpha subunit